MQVNQALVDAHFKRVPGLGALTVGGLSRGDAEDLGGHANGAFHTELLVLGPSDQVSGDCPLHEPLCHAIADGTYPFPSS